MKPPKRTFLVVDDEELMRYLVVSYLSKLGHSCFTATDGVDALEKMKENKIDVVITDIKMDKMNGIALINQISKEYPETPIMVMTAFDKEHTEGTAISIGAREFIKKPFSLDEFAARLQKLINDSETIKRMKKEKNVDENLQDLMKELEKILKNS